MKVRVIAGVDRIARIRASLSESVQVVSLPPVVVYDALWTDPEMTGSVSGRTELVTVGTRVLFGAGLPVNVALAEDEEAVRAVLLHEYGHCFYFTAKVILAYAAGITNLSDLSGPDWNVYTDEVADRARLVEPREWFKGDAAANFPYWNDPRIDRIVQAAPTLAGQFRVEPGSCQFASSHLTVPPDIFDHVRKLQERQAS